MKNIKKFLLIFLLLITLSGCSVSNVSNYTFEEMMDKVFAMNIKLYNKIGSGYKYYAPRGVVRVNSKNNNDVLKRDNITYYLYVDVVGYYYNTDLEYEDNNNSYYYKELKDKNSNVGYIEIDKKSNDYYIQMEYNYAKVEACVKKNELKDAITDITYILKSMNFNDSLLKKLYESGNLASKEEVFKLFKDKEKEGNFLKYVEEYDKYDESKNTDENVIVTTTTKATTTTNSQKEDTTTTAKEETTTTTNKQ